MNLDNGITKKEKKRCVAEKTETVETAKQVANGSI